MKTTLLALIVLFASLTYGQDSKPAPAPAPSVKTTPAVQPIVEAGGLDNLCQGGLGGHFNFDSDTKIFGANDSAESKSLSHASACIGFITGWAHSLSGTFIMEDKTLWYVEVSDSISVSATSDGLHEFLQAHPETRTVPSSLVLLKIAVDEKMAKLTSVDDTDLPQAQQQQHQQKKNENPVVRKN